MEYKNQKMKTIGKLFISVSKKDAAFQFFQNIDEKQG